MDPARVLREIDSSLISLLPKPEIVQNYVDNAQQYDAGEVEQHVETFMKSVKQLERYLIAFKAGGESALEDKRFCEEAGQEPSLSEIQQEHTALQRELQEKDTLLAELTKDLSRWQSALTELQASFKETI